ncbi:MAG TPA: hypothetical protein VGC37_06445 [Friedmanniella sp.]
MTALRTTWAWWTAGLAFALYPALRPYADERALAGLAGMGSTRWLVAHLLGMLGFALLPVALSALGGSDAHAVGRPQLLGPARGLAYAGVVGVLPYYGGEAFGLHAVGAYASAQGDLALLSVVDGFRYQPAALTLFGVGLLALAGSGVLVWVATAGSGRRWRVAAGLLALGLVLFLPQFFAPAPLRVAHGLLLAAGCWAVALAQGSRTSLPRT